MLNLSHFLGVKFLCASVSAFSEDTLQAVVAAVSAAGGHASGSDEESRIDRDKNQGAASPSRVRPDVVAAVQKALMSQERRRRSVGRLRVTRDKHAAAAAIAHRLASALTCSIETLEVGL